MRLCAGEAGEEALQKPEPTTGSVVLPIKEDTEDPPTPARGMRSAVAPAGDPTPAHGLAHMAQLYEQLVITPEKTCRPAACSWKQVMEAQGRGKRACRKIMP